MLRSLRAFYVCAPSASLLQELSEKISAQEGQIAELLRHHRKLQVGACGRLWAPVDACGRLWAEG